MSKKNLTKKIIALIAVIAMFAAMTVTASAATYSTRTMYINGSDVNVRTYVTGLEENDEITYLAISPSDDTVYINQYTAEGSTATFNYKSTVSDITGSTIKMVKVDSYFTDPQIINASDVDASISSLKFVDSNATVLGTIAPETAEAINVGDFIEINAPTHNGVISSVTMTIGQTTVPNVTYAIGSSKVYVENPFTFSVEANGGLVATYNSNIVSTIAENTVTLTFAYTENSEITAPTFIGAMKDTSYELDGETGRLFGIYCNAANVPTGYEVGIEVSSDKAFIEDVTKLAAYGVSSDSKFAIACFDSEDTTSAKTIYYRPYASTGDGYVYGNIGRVVFDAVE